MARVTVEDCLKNVDSRFTLVHLAVRRVLHLRSGAPLTMENTKGNKEVVMALREIAANKITIDNIRQLEESRPAPVEPVLPVPPDAAAATAELKEILEEATSLGGPSTEFEGTEEFREGDLEEEADLGGSEDEI